MASPKLTGSRGLMKGSEGIPEWLHCLGVCEGEWVDSTPSPSGLWTWHKHTQTPVGELAFASEIPSLSASCFIVCVCPQIQEPGPAFTLLVS